MESEIELLRMIVHRYYLKYGSEVQEGICHLSDNFSFSLETEKDKVTCQLDNYSEIGLTSRYEQIKETLEKLRNE
jgi:hypothetical protein